MMVLARTFSIAVLVVTVISTFDCETVYAAELDETRISDTSAPATKSITDSLREERRWFQVQELITATPNTWIFNPGDPPRIVWRDVDKVRHLGVKHPLRVRW